MVTSDAPGGGGVVRAALILLVAVWAVSAGLMYFSTGTGEHDTFMMAAGVVQGMKTGETFNRLNYGTNLQFTYYMLFAALAPALHLDAASVLDLMNFAGVALSLAIPLLLMLLLRRFMPAAQAAFAAVLVMVTPAFLFTLPYGHPFHVAMSLALVSFNLLFAGLDRGRTPQGILCLVTALALHSLALTFRAEQVGLFWCLVAGLLLYRREKSRARWLALSGFCGLSAVLFLAARMAIVPGPESASSPGVVDGLIGLLGYSLPRLETLIPSIAHHIVGVGIPALAATAFVFARLVRAGRWPVAGFVLAAALPPLLIYLNNPSPPRHVISLGMALSVFLALAIPIRRGRTLLLAGAATLAVNLLAPPAIGLVEVAAGKGHRRTYTYNAFERQARNHEQIAAALPFMSKLFDQAPSGTVLIGNWIHVAQATMVAVDRTGASVRVAEPLPGVRAIEVTESGRTILLIERYDADEALELVGRLRAADPGRHFLMIVDPVRDLDELGMDAPAPLYWWSA